MPSLDYAAVADVYDAYCRFDGDVPFFVDAIRTCDGRVLELMAGTGRVSLPMLAAGARVVCVEYEIAMLNVLAEKTKSLSVCADVRALPFARRFPLVLLPFQGLSELTERSDRRQLMREVASVLEPGGRFICTAHNPAARLRGLARDWQVVVSGPVEVSVRGEYDEASRVVTGEQRVVVRDRNREHRLPLRFALPSLEEIVADAEEMTLIDVRGDYQNAPYDEASSPAIIAIFKSDSAS